jgi:cobalt-zinc-cadmium efflux system outer membrane protein
MRHFLGLGLVLLLGAGHLPAQAQGLTVAQAVELALQTHASLQASRHEIRAAEAQLRSAAALTAPEVRLTPGGWGSEPVDERLAVEQPLELNGARRARSRVARGALAETTAAAALTRAELVRQVKAAYWDVALAEQLVGLDRSNLEFAQEMLKAAATQYELGNQPQVQALKAEVEAARARQDLIRSEAALRQAQARLNLLVGREPEAQLALAETPAPVTGELALADLLTLGLRQRPDVQQAQAAVETARGEVSVARAARRTDLSVVGRLTPEGAGGLAVSLNLPQFDWGSRKADVQRAEATVAAREQQLEVVRTDARLEIANALTELQSAQAQAAEYRDRVVEQSRKLADLAMLGYREGASAFLDVLDARRTLRAVNLEYYSAVAAQHSSLAELEFAVGGSLPDPTKPAEVK